MYLPLSFYKFEIIVKRALLQQRGSVINVDLGNKFQKTLNSIKNLSFETKLVLLVWNISLMVQR